MAFQPRAKIGEKVLYWPKYPCSDQPHMGWVVKDGERAQSVLVFTTNNAVVRHTVRHADNPDLPKMREWWADGVWKEHPDEARLKSLETIVAELQAQIIELRKKPQVEKKPRKTGEWSEERKQAQRERLEKVRAAKALKALAGEGS